MKYVIAAILFLLAAAIRADDTPPIGNVPTATRTTSEVDSIMVYLPELRADATRTKTPRPLPTNTPTSTPTPRPTATDAPIGPSPSPIATGDPSRVCNPDNPQWQGANPIYPMCSNRDLAWANSNSNYLTRKLGKNAWATALWDLYGAQVYELRLEKSTQLSQCSSAPDGTGAGGFRRRVAESGSVNINTGALGVGLFKLEMYITMNSGDVRGRNEIFVCVVP